MTRGVSCYVTQCYDADLNVNTESQVVTMLRSMSGDHSALVLARIGQLLYVIPPSPHIQSQRYQLSSDLTAASSVDCSFNYCLSYASSVLICSCGHETLTDLNNRETK